MDVRRDVARRLTLAFATLGCAIASGATQAEVLAVYRLLDDAALTIAVDGERVRTSVASRLPDAHGALSVAVDRRLVSELRRASDVVAVAGPGFLVDGRAYLLLGVARPSVARPGRGYCGAGSEDLLLLVEWQPRSRRLVLRDRLPVQSCLTSMELRSDRGGDLRTALRNIDDPAHVTLTWLSHPHLGAATRTITVNDAGRFVLSP